ncbi:uncharacterized protein METZ01_LOCUS507652, partial [marine metagenome]
MLDGEKLLDTRIHFHEVFCCDHRVLCQVHPAAGGGDHTCGVLKHLDGLRCSTKIKGKGPARAWK